MDQVGTRAANGNGEFDWTVAGVPPGTYYVGGYLYSDGKPYYSHLTQPITIQAAPSSDLQPDRPDVRHLHRRPDGPDPVDGRQRRPPAAWSPSASTPTPAGTATRPWIKFGQAAANGNGEFDWTVAGVPAGTYYVGGYLYSGGKPYYSHLTQSITIQAAAAADLQL